MFDDVFERGTFGFELWQSRYALLIGIQATAASALLTIAISTPLGALLGVVLTYAWWPARLLARLYVDFVRGIPVLVLILFTYFGLSLFGINIPGFWAGVVALSAFATAHVGETVRGALQSVPQGQMEAAKAIGLTFPQRLRYVILPQAMRRALPPWVNTGLEVVKGTTLLSVIGVVELLLASQQIVARNYMVVQFYLFAGLLYLIVNLMIAQLGAALERRYAYLRY